MQFFIMIYRLLLTEDDWSQPDPLCRDVLRRRFSRTGIFWSAVTWHRFLFHCGGESADDPE